MVTFSSLYGQRQCSVEQCLLLLEPGFPGLRAVWRSWAPKASREQRISGRVGWHY